MSDSPLASKFVQARNYTPGPRDVAVDWFVVHDMEMPERATTAEDCANFFANQAKDPAGGPYRGSSANYCIDVDSIVCSVHEDDIAWHAPHANHNGIGAEHAGYASERAEEWADPYSEAELRLSARLAADVCERHRLPIRFVDAAGLKRGDKGITTHWEVTKAFGPVGGHTDPGPNFPMAHYIELVTAAAGGTLPTQEDDDLSPDQFKAMQTWFNYVHAKQDTTNQLLAALVKGQGEDIDIEKLEADSLKKIEAKP